MESEGEPGGGMSDHRNGAQSTPKRGLIIFLVIFGILYLSLGFSFFMMSKEMLAVSEKVPEDYKLGKWSIRLCSFLKLFTALL